MALGARASPACPAARPTSSGPMQSARTIRTLRGCAIRPRSAGDLAAAAAAAPASASAAAPSQRRQEQQEQQLEQEEQRPGQERRAPHQQQPQPAAARALAALASAAPAAAALLGPAARAAWGRRRGLERLLFGQPLVFPTAAGAAGAADGAGTGASGSGAPSPATGGAQRLAMSAVLVAVLAAAAPASAAAPSSASASPAALSFPTLPGNGFNDLFTNRVFLAGYWAWFAAQLLKIFTKRARKGVWDVRAIVDSGGMPSSHSALCAGVTAALAMQQGLGSAAFAMGVAFTAVVMYDAAGVRRHAGRQAEVLNAVVGELLSGVGGSGGGSGSGDDGGAQQQPHQLSGVKLKEVLGHTPLQVTMGCVLGIMVGIFYPAV